MRPILGAIPEFLHVFWYGLLTIGACGADSPLTPKGYVVGLEFGNRAYDTYSPHDPLERADHVEFI